MAVITTDQIQINDIIRFKTLSPHDNVLWSGEVLSLCDYEVASLFGTDIVAYYQDVSKYVEDLPSKESLNYFVLKVASSEAISERRVFALEWIDISTLERVDEYTYTDFRVYDISDDKLADVKGVINSLGYVVDIL